MLRSWTPASSVGSFSSMELCEGARVLLFQNLWPEAGLMNGAMGWLRGFVWPQGGDPSSTRLDLSVPLCLVVEFDDVRVTAQGEEHPFFPGEPDKANWVPIFREKLSSTMEEKVTREQFPLVLSWAITHWKAQGMTLPRARVILGARTAGTHGVAFVAVTRVGHRRRLVFENDLPDWEVFQGVR